MLLEKVQKILSSFGLGSRRNIEKKIVLGKISINGKIVICGEKICKKEIFHIKINNRIINFKKDKIRVLIYNKPIGEICTKKDNFNRIKVFEKLPILKFSQWSSVGRLDINTSGLLIFTNFGELAYRLMHPSYMVYREYSVFLYGFVSKEKIRILKSGVIINNKKCSFKKIKKISSTDNFHSWFVVSLQQGRNREVRNLWNFVGVFVKKLIRIKFGNIILPTFLKKGMYIEFKKHEIQKICRFVNLNYTKYL